MCVYIYFAVVSVLVFFPLANKFQQSFVNELILFLYGHNDNVKTLAT